MSVFKNQMKVDVQLSTPEGRSLLVVAGHQFTGTNFFKQYTAEGGAIGDRQYLQLITDDGAPYTDTVTYHSMRVPNRARDWSFAVASGEGFSSHVYNFTTGALFGAAAMYLRITTAGGTIQARFNDDATGLLTLTTGTTFISEMGQLVVNKIEFRYVGGATTNVYMYGTAFYAP